MVRGKQWLRFGADAARVAGAVALAWRLIPAGVALVALVAALLGARRYIAALWFIPSLGAIELPWATASCQGFALPWNLPWYFIWGFPTH